MAERASFVSDRSAPASGGVAILMRTRDRPVLLARAVASVLAQACEDWHLVLVNDGGDRAPVEALLARHETGFAGRVSVLHHPDSLGRQAAANAALARAGELAAEVGPVGFVALLDDDDSWHPDFLARTLRWLGQPGRERFAAVLSWWRVVRERLDADGVIEDGRDDSQLDGPVLALEDMLGRNRVPINGLLFRWDAVASAGRFDAVLPVLEDWDFILRVMEQGDIGVLPERLANYHHRDANTLPAYLNSAQEPEQAHAEQFIRYRNARLRALVERDPGALVLLGSLGLRAERYHEQAELQHGRILANLDRNGLWGHARHEDLQHRLIRVEAMLDTLMQRLDASQAAVGAQASGQASGPVPAPPRRPLWKRAARRLAGPLIDGLRRRSA